MDIIGYTAACSNVGDGSARYIEKFEPESRRVSKNNIFTAGMLVGISGGKGR